MKKLTSLILIAGLILTIFSAQAFAAPGNSPYIQVTATYDKFVGGISFAGYNINGYDAYNYKFAAGDRFEYEVYLETKAAGIGYIDIQGSKLKSVDADGIEVHDWKMLRETSTFDSEGIECHPANDLTEVAYQKWYKRTITLPKSFEGFLTRHIFPMAYKAQVSTPVLPTTPEVFYIRNVNIVGMDGKVKMAIFTDSEKFISSNKVEAQGAKLVLVGKNQKAVTKAPTAAVSKTSTTTSTAASSSIESTVQTVSESTSSVSSAAYSMAEGTDSMVSGDNSSGSASDGKNSSNIIIIILSAVIILLIAGGITGFLFLKKRMVK